MTKILLTAFQPYGQYRHNASWLCLQEVTRSLPEVPSLTTRLYPVDFQKAKAALEKDLAGGFDFAIHLGQAPGAAALRLESFALNVGSLPDAPASEHFVLDDNGPQAYRSTLPVDGWADMLRQNGLPAQVSYHAGTYLCNAVYYWSLAHARRHELKPRSLFVHLPLETRQVTEENLNQPSLPATSTAQAMLWILEEMVRLR